MKTIGNILWLIFGGLVSAILWTIYGILWCITIIGIPMGSVCFKMASLSLWPFGRDVEFNGGFPSVIANVLWVILTGFEMAIVDVVIGALLCITIVGIPFGLQFFKFAKLSIIPFGSNIV